MISIQSPFSLSKLLSISMLLSKYSWRNNNVPINQLKFQIIIIPDNFIMNVQDSLDNLSALHLSQQRSLLAQIKQKFAIALQKLQSPQTREIGISELRKLIDNYREPDHLRNYIALMKTLKPSPSSSTKEHQILVISILASTFKEQLLDPIDKPQSISKTCFRIVQILHGYFSDRSPTVQQACARALLDLSNHCLANQQPETVYSIIYTPLISILKSGVDKGSQATAAACLNQLINYCRSIGNNDIIVRLSPDLLAVILKVNCQYHQLFQAVSSMLEIQKRDFLDNKLVTFLSKILAVISGTRESSNPGSLNSYMCKVHVCRIIQQIGTFLSSDQKDKFVDLNVSDALVQASRHRIMQVQLAASRAIRAWKGEAVYSPPKNGLASLEEKRNSKLRQRSRSKQQTAKIQKQLTFMKQDLEKLVKGGWGASNRAKNYVKRGTGIGGGSHGKNELSPSNRSNSKSHKQQLQQLRQHIKKGHQQYKNIDRFSLPNIDKKQGSKSRSPPKHSQHDDVINQIQLDVDSGDQAFYVAKKKPESPKSIKAKSNNNNNKIFKDLGISAEEAKELMQHEQSLMAEQKDLKVNYYTEKSQSINGLKVSRKNSDKNSDKNANNSDDSLQKHPQPQRKIQAKPQRKPQNKPENNRQNRQNEKQLKQQFSIPLSKQVKQPQPISQMKKSNILSQNQIHELVEEYNLSQVSENMNGILNESDLHMIEQTTPDHSQQAKAEVQQIKQRLAEKKARKSIMDKFFKKEEKNEMKLQPLKFQLPKPIYTSPPKDISPQRTLQPQQVNNSLNYTQSLMSRDKSRQQIQFTLNPKDKFSSLKVQPKSLQKQIQQQIAMSQYQQSVPKGQQLPMIKQIPRPKQPQAEVEANFQQIIKNPPRREQPVSSIKSKSEKQYSQYDAPQDEGNDVGNQWLDIITLMKNGQINDAFQSAIELDDPIYLLRLMLISKCPLRKLTAQTVRNLWNKFNEIYSHRLVDTLTVGLLDEAQDLGLLTRCLPVQQMEDVLVSLFEISGVNKGRLSYKAATLYNNIEKTLHPS